MKAFKNATFEKGWHFLVKYFFDDESNKNDDGCQDNPHNNKFHILLFWVNTTKTGIVLGILRIVHIFFCFLCTLALFFRTDDT